MDIAIPTGGFLPIKLSHGSAVVPASRPSIKQHCAQKVMTWVVSEH